VKEGKDLRKGGDKSSEQANGRENAMMEREREREREKTRKRRKKEGRKRV